MKVALEYLSDLQKAQLIKFYPELEWNNEKKKQCAILTIAKELSNLKVSCAK